MRFFVTSFCLCVTILSFLSSGTKVNQGPIVDLVRLGRQMEREAKKEHNKELHRRELVHEKFDAVYERDADEFKDESEWERKILTRIRNRVYDHLKKKKSARGENHGKPSGHDQVAPASLTHPTPAPAAHVRDSLPAVHAHDLVPAAHDPSASSAPLGSDRKRRGRRLRPEWEFRVIRELRRQFNAAEPTNGQFADSSNQFEELVTQAIEWAKEERQKKMEEREQDRLEEEALGITTETQKRRYRLFGRGSEQDLVN